MPTVPEALTELLGTRHPIVQAPMANISRARLAAAASAAGALGSLGSAVLPPERIEAEVGEIRAATDRPFALNFFCHTPPRVDTAAAQRMWQRLEPHRRRLGVEELPTLAGPPPFGEALLELVLRLRPKVVSFHFGLPGEAALRRLHQAGIVVLSTATTVAEAVELAARGADAIIAQGLEAGGHRGSFTEGAADAQLGTLALVPQVVDAVRVPVIAAGGIHDGRGIAAAFLLGAAGVQLGTAFLGCPEAELDPLYRQTLRSPRAARTRLTRLLSGRPARAIVVGLFDELADAEGEALDFPLQRVLVGRLDEVASARGEAELHAMWAGQAAPALRELPAAELVATLVRETDAALAART